MSTVNFVKDLSTCTKSPRENLGLEIRFIYFSRVISSDVLIHSSVFLRISSPQSHQLLTCMNLFTTIIHLRGIDCVFFFFKKQRARYSLFCRSVARCNQRLDARTEG